MNDTTGAKAHRVPDAAIAAFTATLLVIMLATPATREWLGQQVALPFAYLGQVVVTVWDGVLNAVSAVAGFLAQAL